MFNPAVLWRSVTKLPDRKPKPQVWVCGRSKMRSDKEVKMLDHIALVTDDIERLKEFYTRYFDGAAEPNWTDGTAEICFINFENGTKIELQKKEHPERIDKDREKIYGIAHLAFLAKSRTEVREKTKRLIDAGIALRSQPTAYGEDFFESSFFDPDGNVVELTVGSQYIRAEQSA